MLATHTIADPSAKPEFPYPGSAALWQLKPCVVIQHNRDGTILVSGRDFRRHVARDELLDAARVTLKPFARWLADRIDRVDPARTDRYTPVAALHDDWLAWCEAEGVSTMGEDLAIFADKLSGAGIHSRTITRRLRYTDRPSHECGFAAGLKPGIAA